MGSEIKVLSNHPQLPASEAEFLRKRLALKAELLKQSNLIPTRVAILGGSTTSELKKSLEVLLLAEGFQASFYESGYNRFWDDVEFENQDLWDFKPEIVYIHTSWHNILNFPRLLEGAEDVERRIQAEMARFQSMWEKIHNRLGAVIIQNNFDLPRLRPLGNLEASESYGRVNFLLRLNVEFANYARRHSRFLINDMLYLSAQVGLSAWHEHNYWYHFHMALGPTATVTVARNLAGIIKAIYGKSKKRLILDLDNTLWGGVIGDEGIQNLVLGRDNAVGEAFVDFQQYVKALQMRGVILAVCSKNDPENAKAGLAHADTVLKLEDFSAFKANWNPKDQNIREIAAELNIGLDSMVFIDDNPAERALVAAQLPEVAVPNVGSDVSRFAEVIEQNRYFEVDKIVADDLSRSEYYSSNAQRSAAESSFRDYGEFLASLAMSAEIAPFCPAYLERITQLINKTNQFNLTTRRYTTAEVEAIAISSSYITLYGRLADKFGDNGLVSIVTGKVSGKTIEMDLWLMSCRVLKREMELAMFDALVEECQARGIRHIVGVYIPSKKNGMVAGHYEGLGFTRLENSDGRQMWHYELPEVYSKRTSHISRIGAPLAAAIS